MVLVEVVGAHCCHTALLLAIVHLYNISLFVCFHSLFYLKKEKKKKKKEEEKNSPFLSGTNHSDGMVDDTSVS